MNPTQPTNEFQQKYNSDPVFKQSMDTAKSQGLDLNAGMKIYQSQVQQQQDQQQQSDQPGFWHGLVQDVAHPFLKMAASGISLVEQTKGIYQMVTGNKAGANETFAQVDKENKEGADFGWFGKAKPLQNPWDAMGTGAEIGTWIIPVGPEAKVAEELAVQGGKEAAVQISKGAAESVAQDVTKGLGSKALTFFKSAAPFSATMTAGKTLQDIGEGKDAGTVLSDAAKTAVGSLAGMLAFSGVSAIMKNVASQALESKVAQQAGQYVNKFLSDTLNLGPEFEGKNVLNPKDFGMMTNALKQQYESVKNKTVGALSDFFKLPVDTQSLYNEWGAGMEDAASKMKKAVDTKYGEAFSPAHTVTQLDATRNAVGTAEKMIEEGGGGSGPKSANQFNSLIEGKGPSDSFSKFIGQVRQVLGTNDSSNGVNLSQVRDLFLKSSSVGESAEEKKMAENIGQTLYNDAHTEMRASEIPAKQQAAAQMQGARNELLQQKTMVSSWMSKLRSIGDPMQFFESKILGDEPKAIDLNVINSLPEEAKNQFGDLMYEMLRQKTTGALSKAGDTEANAKVIDEVLGAWGNTGLFTPQHISNLTMLSNAMKGTFDDVISHLQSIGDESAQKAADLATQASEKGTQSEAMSSLGKAMGDKPIFTANPDGTSDFSNLSKSLEKANTNGEYDDLVSMLKGYKDLTAVPASKAKAIVNSVIGAALLPSGHPIIGTGMLARGLAELIGKPVEKVSIQDMNKLITGMITDGTLKPADLGNLLTGKYQAFIDAAGKASVVAGQEGAKQVGEIK